MKSFLLAVTLLDACVRAASGSDLWADLTEQAKHLSTAGRLREAQDCLLQALKEADRFEPNDVRRPQTLGLLGTAAWNLGKAAEAEQLYLRAISLWERNGIRNHPDFAATLSCLATIRLICGRYREAERLYYRSLEMTNAIFGRDSPESTVARKDLAALHNALGQYEKTITLLDADADVWGHVPSVHRAAMLNILGLAEHGLGKHDEAARHIAAALAIRREVLGPGHPKIAEASSNLALVKISLDQFKEAETLLEESLSIVQAAFGPGHPLEARVRRIYAHLLRQTRRTSEARAMLNEALRIEETSGQALRGKYSVDLEELRRISTK